MRKLLLNLLCIGFMLGANAQTPVIDFNNFKPLQSNGILPDEVEMTGKDFIESSKKNISKGGARKDKKAKEQFLLETSYAIKDLFVSGRVLYNDPISAYVEKVRLEVTATDPQLASETKVFVIKSAVVNAFATNQGYIFITTGLLSQLENESQLAFVLCHELIHYKKKHVFKAYVESQKIERGDGAYRKSSIDQKYLAKNNYSKENETEADVLGFELFAETSYAYSEIDGLFDVLKYSDLPFEDIEFTTKDLLETPNLILPAEYRLDEIETAEGEDDEKDDKNSTHPNLKKRRDEIQDKIDGLTVDQKSKARRLFVVSESQFNTAQKTARFDLCHTALINRDYDQALYNAYCLLKDDPNSVYLKKIVLKSLYGFTKYSNAKRFREVSTNFKKVEGESQRVNFLFDKMESNEINVVALNYAWRLKKSLKSEDTEVNMITEDIFYEMVKKHYPNKSTFSLEPRKTPVKADTTAKADKTIVSKGKEDEDDGSSKKTPSKSKTTTDKKESKTSKIKKKKNKVATEDYFITYAFVDLLKDPDFNDAYDRLAKQAKKDKSAEKKEGSKIKTSRNKKKKADSESDEDEDEDENQYILDEKEIADKYNDKWDCYALGVEKVLFLNPFYLKVDERKKNPVLYAGSDDAQKKFNEEISNMASSLKLDVEFLDKKQFTTSSVDNYNDMCLLIDWLDERIDHKKLKMIPTDYLQVDAISKKYGTEYLGLIGAINYIEKKRGMGLAIAASVFLPVYSWLFTFPYMFTKKTDTYVYTIVFNIKTGQPEMVNVGNASLSDKKDVVRSFLYDHLKQVKRKGKAKNK